MTTQDAHQTDFAELMQGWEGHEPRPVQIRMMSAIERALQDREHIMVEAGTGAGKSFGYLLPALLSKRKPIVISTGSIALQEQLLHKDIPALSKHLYGDEKKINARLAKGRQNYLCIHKLEEVENSFGPVKARENVETKQNRLQIQTLRGELYDGWEGDRSMLSTEIPQPFWREVASQSEDCLGWRCRFFDQNPYRMAREDLELADIIVTNHALYCQDVVSGGGLLPPHELVVFDEAHSLYGYALNAFSSRIGRYRGLQLVGRIHKQLMPLPDTLMWHLKEAEANFMHWLLQKSKRQSTIRLYPDEAMGELVREIHDVLTEVMEWVQGLDVLQLPIVQSASNKQQQVENQQEKLKEQLKDLRDSWSHFLYEASGHDAVHRVNWAEIDHERMSFQLISTPLEVDYLLRNAIWANRQAVLTSATLSVRNRLSYFRDLLGLNGLAMNAEGDSIEINARELVLPSAFDFQTQALCYIPLATEIPETPHGEGYHVALMERMTDLLEASQGRAFLLFTSYAAMHKAAESLMQRVDFPIRMQGDFPRHRLIQWFKETDNPVLLGTATFWEGIDIPGEQLSLVVIDRLPFTSPDEPIHQATVERLKEKGEDWFQGYAVPQAIIKLKQGVGRLIRTASDRGVVALMDTRLRTKGYGRGMMMSLPKMRVTPSMEDVRAFYKKVSVPDSVSLVDHCEP